MFGLGDTAEVGYLRVSYSGRLIAPDAVEYAFSDAHDLCLVLLAVLFVPLVKGLLGRRRCFAMLSPGIQIVVDDKAREQFESSLSAGGSDAVELGVAEHFSGSDHGGFFRQLDLVLFVHHAAPRVDLIVDIDLYRTDIRAAAVQRG